MKWEATAVLFQMLAAVVACGHGSSPAAPTEASVGEPFDLRVGGVAVIAAEGLRIEFDRVANDSRCPTGVTCIWEGDAVVKVWLQKAPQERESHELHANTRAGSGEASYHGYQLSLVGLAPYPRGETPIAARDYVATFRVGRR